MKKALWALVLCRSVLASIVLDTDAAQQIDNAVFQADVEILSSSTMSDDRTYAVTRTLARVNAIHATRPDGGWIPDVGNTFWLDTPGGEIGETGVTYSTYPRAYVGRRYHAALRRLNNGAFASVASGQGLVDMDARRNFSRNRTDGSNGQGTGAYLHWDSAYMPIPYYISFPTLGFRLEWVDAIDASFGAWREREDTMLEFLPMGCAQTAANLNDGVNTLIYVTNDWPFEVTAIAITRNFYVAGDGPRAGLILDTDIMLNGDETLINQGIAHGFTTTGEANCHDLQNILTHEVGHFIGLGHETTPKDSDATMYETAQLGETLKRSLSQNDIDGLMSAYSGVGQKVWLFSSAAACAMSSGIFSCAAVHGSRPDPETVVWMFLAIGLSFGAGRTVIRALKRRRE
ncbi:matrixin family metalloprotease [bacterium]|nr:matrixin family metalloprotease [bacterium]